MTALPSWIATVILSSAQLSGGPGFERALAYVREQPYRLEYSCVPGLPGLESAKPAEVIAAYRQTRGLTSDSDARRALTLLLTYKQEDEERENGETKPRSSDLLELLRSTGFRPQIADDVCRCLYFGEDGEARMKAFGAVQPRSVGEYWAGRVLHEDGDRAGALKRYEASLKLDAGSPRTRFLQAVALVDEGRGADALASLRAIPRNWAPLAVNYWTARALMTASRPREAIAILKTLGIERVAEATFPEASVNSMPAEGTAPVCALGEAQRLAGDLVEARSTLGDRDECSLERVHLEEATGRPFDALRLLSDHGSARDTLRLLITLKACVWAGRDLEQMTSSCPGEEYHPDYCPALPALRKDFETACPKTLAPEPPLDPILDRRLRAPRIIPFEEREIPDEWKWTGSEDRKEPELTPYPALKDEAIVFITPSAPRMFAISVSQDVDPRGEVSMGGYWLLRSSDAGRTWSRPAYLGFAHQYPYTIPPESRVPSFDGTRLQIEVERREVDETTITFPPVALRAKGVKRNLYLSLDLERILRDSDGDGMSDLLEEKLLLDPDAADTDGDKTPDGSDPLPLQAGDPDPLDRETALFGAILPAMLGGGDPVQQSAAGAGETSAMSIPGEPFASGRVVFLSGSVRFRHNDGLHAIAIPEAALDAYSRKFGRTFPLSPLNVAYDETRTRALVQYSFGWYGGTIALSWKSDRWVIDARSGWIT